MAKTFDFKDEDEGFFSTGHIIIMTFVALLVVLFGK